MKSLVLDYLALRKLIGIFGLLLPFVLVIGAELIQPGPLPGSISAYYYTPMGRVLIGVLCAIGTFLLTYRGYGSDWILMQIAAVCAFGVAWLPTTPVSGATRLDDVVGILHGTFSGVMFFTLGCVSLFVFTKTWKPRMTLEKRRRNAVYRVCGGIIFVALALVWPLDHWLRIPYSMFFLETAAVEAFSVSWLVKGQAILPDKKITAMELRDGYGRA